MTVLLAFIVLMALPLGTAILGVLAFRPRGRLGPILTAWLCGLLVSLGGGWVVWRAVSLFAPPSTQLVALGLALALGLLAAPPLLVREVAQADARAAARRDVSAFD